MPVSYRRPDSASDRRVPSHVPFQPIEIYINQGAKLTLHGLQQYFVKLEEKAKNRKLVDLLDGLEFNQVVIFVKSTSRAAMLNRLLNEENFPSIATYGKMDQEKRYVLPS